ncbi:MAG TPA: hypothetical protein DD639_00865, partial [Acinetobacter sp.]|nr:hypothetical protein [Acinetobacter sp.]
AKTVSGCAVSKSPNSTPKIAAIKICVFKFILKNKELMNYQYYGMCLLKIRAIFCHSSNNKKTIKLMVFLL